jgi:hypothetical protein
MKAKMPAWRKVKEYVVLGVVNSLTVYAVYTPYVFLWVGFTWAQYVRWLEGGIAYSLLTGWLFALVVVKARKRLFGAPVERLRPYGRPTDEDLAWEYRRYRE